MESNKETLEHSESEADLSKKQSKIRWNWLIIGILLFLIGLSLPGVATYIYSGYRKKSPPIEVPIPTPPKDQNKIALKRANQKQKTEVESKNVSSKELYKINTDEAFKGDRQKVFNNNPNDISLNLLAFQSVEDKTENNTNAVNPTPTPKPAKSDEDKKNRNIFEKFIDWVVGLFKKKKSAQVTALTLSSKEITQACQLGTTPTDDSCSVNTAVQVTTTADNLPKSGLKYAYKVSGGRIIGSGANVKWDLSDVRPGTYTIMVGLDEGQGVTGGTKTETLSVKECPSCNRIVFANVDSITLSGSEIVIPCPPGQVAREGESCPEGTTISVATAASSSDPNDILTYNYTVSGGRIIGSGANVTWDLSGVRPGTYTITVGADNGQGILGATKTETITVKECNACAILCDCPTVDVSGGDQIRLGAMSFTANVNGGGDFTYEWSVSAGSISSGQGTPSITVDTTGLTNGTNITATVVIGGGLCAGCVPTDSETGSVSGFQTPNNNTNTDTNDSNKSANINANVNANFNANVNTNINANGSENNAQNNSNTLTNVNQDEGSDRIVYDYPAYFLEKDRIYEVNLRLDYVEGTVTETTTQSNVNSVMTNVATTKTTRPLPIAPEGYEIWVDVNLTPVESLQLLEKTGGWTKYAKKFGQPSVNWQWKLKLDDTTKDSEKTRFVLQLIYGFKLKDSDDAPIINQEKAWETVPPLEGDLKLPFFVWLLSILSGLSGASLTALGVINRKTIKVNNVPVVADEVQCTLYSPPEVTAGDTLTVQVFAYLLEQKAEVSRMAKTSDEEVRESIAQSIGKIKRGTNLKFELIMPGLKVENPEESRIWEGRPIWVPFLVPIPEDYVSSKIAGNVYVYENDRKIGTIHFSVKIKQRSILYLITSFPILIVRRLIGTEQKEGQMSRYETAFISYASADKAEVYSYLRFLDAFKVSYHVDIFDIPPGDRWEQKLYEFIDKDEAFLLFWSEAAKQSEWVLREAERANERSGRERKNPPRIVIIHLDDPEVPLPEWLRDIQYDRKWKEFIRNARNQREQ